MNRYLFKGILFALILNAAGWASWFLGEAGMMLWLVSPLLVSVVFRLVQKNRKGTGIRLMFRGNLFSYLFGVLYFPAAVAVVIAVGAVTGLIFLRDFRGDIFLQAAAAGFLFTFVKNIFEEFAWRGFLTPTFIEAGLHPLANHLLTGLIWGSWHLPYYLGLLDSSVISVYSSLQLPVFVIITLVSMLPAAILFGELRLLSGSTWPAVLLHTFSNIIIMNLLTGGQLVFNGPGELLLSPGWHGIVMMILILASGLALYRHRTKKELYT